MFATLSALCARLRRRSSRPDPRRPLRLEALEERMLLSAGPTIDFAIPTTTQPYAVTLQTQGPDSSRGGTVQAGTEAVGSPSPGHFLAEISHLGEQAGRPASHAGSDTTSLTPRPGTPVHASGLETQTMLAAASPQAPQSGSLFISGHLASQTDYKALVEPGGVVDPLRLQIFTAMMHNPVRTFHFASLQAAQQNFKLRVDMLQLMNAISRDDPHNPHHYNLTINGSRPNFDYYDEAKMDQTANPTYWHIGPDSNIELQYHGTDAFDAIMSIVKAPYRGECLGTAEITVLYATAEVLGKSAFNHLFPSGLTFGFDPYHLTSALSLVQEMDFHGPWDGGQATISTTGMVPGDWVYMKNLSTYSGGPYNGENAIYMGRYDWILHGKPIYQSGATPRFSGLGLYDRTAPELRQDLWDGYCRDVLHTPDSPIPAWATKQIGWFNDLLPATTSY